MHTYFALIALSLAAVVTYMTLGFAIAAYRRRIDTVDALWGGGFVVAAWLIAGLELQWRTILIALLIDVWAVRLTSHIIDRSRARKEDDPRYIELTKKWSNKNAYWLQVYVMIFLLQAVLIVGISLPVVFAAGHSNSWAVPWAIVGSLVWLAGFIVELLADQQLARFLRTKKTKKVLDTGLWSRSRHPNYLGEITQWFGVGIIACGSYRGWIGLLGPLGLYLLIRYVSGVPPIEKRRANDKAYQAYIARTNALFPRIKR